MLDNLQFQLIQSHPDARERYFERRCEGLQNDLVSPAIMRTGREVHVQPLEHREGSYIACLINEQREVQAFARLVPIDCFEEGDVVLLDYVDQLSWWNPRTLEITALVVGRCPFDGDDAQLQWRQNLIVSLFANLANHMASERSNRLLLLTQRPLLSAFAKCHYPSKRVHMHTPQYNCLYFGFRISTIDASPNVPVLGSRSFEIANDAAAIFSKW